MNKLVPSRALTRYFLSRRRTAFCEVRTKCLDKYQALNNEADAIFALPISGQ
jgi:hypothetical protein